VIHASPREWVRRGDLREPAARSDHDVDIEAELGADHMFHGGGDGCR
jgi:hypothetical protein